MSKSRFTLKDERNDALFKRYNEIVKDLMEQGLDLGARQKYDMAAEGFFINGKAAGEIIQKMIKNQKNKRSGHT